jgi:hypothetical protein
MRSSWISVGVFLVLGVLPVFRLMAAEPASGTVSGDVPLLSAQVRQSVQDRNFPEARKAIEEAARAKDAPHDYLAYLKGWSFYLEKQYDPALAAYEQFE